MNSLTTSLRIPWVFGSSGAIGYICLAALQGGMNQIALISAATVGFFYAVLFGVGDGINVFPDLGWLIEPAETITWSWQNVYRSFGTNVKKGVMLGMTILAIVVVAVSVSSSLVYGWHYGLRYGFIFGIEVGLYAIVAGILTGCLTSGWSSDMLDEGHHFSRPNEGTRRSLSHALFAGSLFGPIGGVISGCISGLAFGLGGVAGWPVLAGGFSIIFGCLFGFYFFSWYGGIAYFEHYILRFFLWRSGAMTWFYVRFLDYATEHILLRKVGGGYMFVHRLLQDYFAGLYKPPVEADL